MSNSSAIEFSVALEDSSNSRTFSRKSRPVWSTLQAELRERFNQAEERELRLSYLDSKSDKVTIHTEQDWETAWEAAKSHSVEPLCFTLADATPSSAARFPEVDDSKVPEISVFTPRTEHEGEPVSITSPVASAFVPATESGELRRPSESTSSSGSDSPVVKLQSVDSWPSSESGSDVGLVIVSKEEAAAAETDWEHKDAAKTSAVFSPTVRSPPQSNPDDANPEPTSALTPVTESLADKFNPVTETVSGVSYQEEKLEAIGSSAGLRDATQVPLPSDSASDTSETVLAEGAQIGPSIRIDTSVSPEASMTGSPKVIYASPVFTDNAGPSPSSAGPTDTAQSDFFEERREIQNVQTDSDSDARTSRAQRAPTHLGRCESSSPKSHSTIQDLLSQPSHRSRTSFVSGTSPLKVSQARSERGHREPPLSHGAPPRRQLVSPSRNRRGPAPTRSRVTSKLDLVAPHTRVPSGPHSTSQIVVQCRDALAASPEFYYTLKGLLAEHEERAHMGGWASMRSRMQPMREVFESEDSDWPRRRAPSREHWYDALDTDTQTDSDNETFSLLRRSGPTRIQKQAALAPTKIKPTSASDLGKIKTPIRPVYTSDSDIPAEAVAPRQSQPILHITRATEEFDHAPKPPRARTLVSSHHISGTTQQRAHVTSFRSRAAVPPGDDRLPHHSSTAHTAKIHAFIPRSETLENAESARISDIARNLPAVPKLRHRDVSRAEPIQAPLHLPNRRHTHGNSIHPVSFPMQREREGEFRRRQELRDGFATAGSMRSSAVNAPRKPHRRHTKDTISPVHPPFAPKILTRKMAPASHTRTADE